MKKLEQGISDFKEFITEGCYFVDKSHLIAHLIDHPSKVHLITRPRRFGKTLNLSMIRYFFEALPPDKESANPPNAALFEGLSITEHPRFGEFMGQYPVIHLSFKNVKGTTGKATLHSIQAILADEFDRHSYLADTGFLNDEKLEFFRRIQKRKGTEEDYVESLKNLSSWLNRAYGKPVYILLDEYDTPLQTAYVKNYYDEIIDFIRSFMVQTFKDNPHLKQAVIIGILKVAQESLFSDFNNPAVSTVLNEAMKDCFGFTEDEVEAMASHYSQKSKLDGIRQWYNGYIFGGDTVIYNPWSIVSYFRNSKDGLQPYWVNTSDNRLIKDVLQLNRRDGRETIERLLKGEEVRREVMINIAYPQIRTRQDVVWSFLLHGGYLNASERRQHDTFQDFRLDIPNREVRYSYLNIIKAWLEEDLEASESFQDFIRGIREGDTRLIERGLGSILFGLASYYDGAPAGRNDEWERTEGFYHGLILGMLAYLGSDYIVESNRECGMGRPDIVLIQRGHGPEGSAKVLLFEFKQEAADGSTPLKELARRAYSQAKRKYLKGVKEKWGPGEVLILGVGFRGKELSMRDEG